MTSITETLAIALGSGVIPLPAGWRMLLVGGWGPRAGHAAQVEDPCGEAYTVEDLLAVGLVELAWNPREVEARRNKPMFGLKAGTGYNR
jgi:hypothetical protein